MEAEYLVEYELRASERTVFQYISTPSGLEQWFAENIVVRSNDNLFFELDGDEYLVHMSVHRNTKSVKFEFIEEEANGTDLPYIELVIEKNQLTEAMYLIIKDASGLVNSQEECYEIWESAINDLKVIIGA